jgi:DivIVA domain-containing protein
MAGLGQVCGRCGADAAYDAGGFAGWVETRKFSTTRLRPGYDMEQVDAFLGAIRDTFLGIGGPPLTPDEIRAKQFSTTRLRPGYDEEEVDAFLDEAELKLAAQVGAAGGAPARSRPSTAADAESGPESVEGARMCARCGNSVPLDPADEVKTECPYCGASLRRRLFRRRADSPVGKLTGTVSAG